MAQPQAVGDGCIGIKSILETLDTVASVWAEDHHQFKTVRVESCRVGWIEMTALTIEP